MLSFPGSVSVALLPLEQKERVQFPPRNEEDFKVKHFFLFWLLAGIGCIVGLSPFMYYLHELGHLQSFTFDGIRAEITSPTITMTEKTTFHGLAAGCLSEFMTFWLLYWLLLSLTRKDGKGFSSCWFSIGFPLGICTIVFFKAFFYDDFNREWSADLQLIWLLTVSPLLLFSWVIAILARLK
jgi:hypothetical protein